MLQAEADRDQVRRHLAAEEREKFLMKDNPDWKFGSVYHSDRYADAWNVSFGRPDANWRQIRQAHIHCYAVGGIQEIDYSLE